VAKRGAKGAIGVSYRHGVSAGLPVGARVKCADNSGDKNSSDIGVIGLKGRLRKLISASRLEIWL